MSDKFYVCPEVGCVYALELGAVLIYQPLKVDGTYDKSLLQFAEVEWEHLDASTEFWAERALVALKS